jgi:hypothetical protein
VGGVAAASRRVVRRAISSRLARGETGAMGSFGGRRRTAAPRVAAAAAAASSQGRGDVSVEGWTAVIRGVLGSSV